ncbi:hypothetical protein B0H13DRAFT_2391698 [Mycena leptocephala]|nr:hypothetical protein B0H13DRAFT_2391698 [Mycena leptocephala]
MPITKLLDAVLGAHEKKNYKRWARGRFLNWGVRAPSWRSARSACSFSHWEGEGGSPASSRQAAGMLAPQAIHYRALQALPSFASARRVGRVPAPEASLPPSFPRDPHSAELKSFLQFHRTGEEPLRDDEISILNGVLELLTRSMRS